MRIKWLVVIAKSPKGYLQTLSALLFFSIGDPLNTFFEMGYPRLEKPKIDYMFMLEHKDCG